MYFCSVVTLALCFAASQVLGKVGKCDSRLIFNGFESCKCDPTSFYDNETLTYMMVPNDDEFEDVESSFQHNECLAGGTYKITIFRKLINSYKQQVFGRQIRVFYDGNGKFIGKSMKSEAKHLEFHGHVIWCDTEVLYLSFCSSHGVEGGAYYRLVLSKTGEPLKDHQKAEIEKYEGLNMFGCSLKEL